jgi:hypothetical protein
LASDPQPARPRPSAVAAMAKTPALRDVVNLFSRQLESGP